MYTCLKKLPIETLRLWNTKTLLYNAVVNPNWFNLIERSGSSPGWILPKPFAPLVTTSALFDSDSHSIVYSPTRVKLSSDTEITTLSPVVIPQSPLSIKTTKNDPYYGRVSNYFFSKLKEWLSSDFEMLLDYLVD